MNATLRIDVASPTRSSHLGHLITLIIGMAMSACNCGGTGVCDPGKPGSCEKNLVCEAVTGGDPICVPETVVTGKVLDAETQAAIAGARVVAIDANTNVATSNVAVTDAQGNYRARIQFPRSNQAGTDVKSGSFTLRVSAKRYQEFPSAVRQAIPLMVTRADKPDALPGNTRDVALLALRGVDATTLGAISGHARQGGNGIAGVLVVAEGTGGSYSAITDSTGAFSVLNLAPGTYSVRGYSAGEAFVPVSGLSLANGEHKTGVVLEVDAAARLFKLTGGIQIVNGQTSTTETLIVLALASTREVPAGLSAMTVNSRFEIAGIPPGTYDILASYNNDDLVIDPDPSQLPRPIRVNLPVDAPSGSLDVGSFKITGDVKILSPGAAIAGQVEAPVAAAGLTFRWEDDSGEDFYGLEVIDAFGARIWGSEPSKTTEPTVKPPKSAVSFTYAGPTLSPGATYQWRITSYKCTVSQTPCTSLDPLSSSENLRGIFEVAR